MLPNEGQKNPLHQTQYFNRIAKNRVQIGRVGEGNPKLLLGFPILAPLYYAKNLCALFAICGVVSGSGWLAYKP